MAWSDARFNLSPAGETKFIDGVWVSGSFFSVLGVRAALGRMLTQADDAPGGGSDGPVAVLSYDFWQRQFGGAPDAIGRILTIDRVAFTVVGVAPRRFFGVDVGYSFDVAAPLETQPLVRVAPAPNANFRPLVSILGRLRADQTVDSATAALRSIQPQIREATLPAGWPQAFLDRYLKNAFTLVAAPAGASLLRRRFSRPLLVIMVIVGLTLLVAGANLTNLALTRADGRSREFGMRLALGASRGRLVRQLLAESGLLAGAGSVGGIFLAAWGARVMVRQLATTVASTGPHATTGHILFDVSIDWRVLGYTLFLAALAMVVFGVIPAFRSSRISPLDATRNSRTFAWSFRTAGPATALVIVQVAISFSVVIAAGLLTRTLAALEARPLGFDHQAILIANLDAQHVAIPANRRPALYAEILDAVRTVPGVAAAALSWNPPVFTGPALGQPIQSVSGAAPLPPRGANSGLNLVSPHWFETMGIPLVNGRDVTSADRINTPPVVVVNQAFARRFLPSTNPIGHAVTLFLPGAPRPPVEIVGVVSNTVYGGMRNEIEPMMFLPIAQRDSAWEQFLASPSLAIKVTSDDRPMLTRRIAAVISAASPDLSMTFHPLDDYLDDSLVQERLTALLAGSFAMVAMLLAAVGLYGVTAYAVARRRKEIGIRMALGAEPGRVVTLILSRTVFLVALGVALGGALSMWATTGLAALLSKSATSRSCDVSGCGRSAGRDCAPGKLAAGSARGED